MGAAAPGARDRAGVVVKDAHDVGSREDDTELEGELCGVGVACELLQLFLRLEQSVDTALGHARDLSEPADGQAVEPFDRRRS